MTPSSQPSKLFENHPHHSAMTQIKQSVGGHINKQMERQQRQSALDPITVEVIHSALMSFIRDMRRIIIQTAVGVNLRERHDFSCALQDSEGELVAIYQDNPPHVVPTVYAVRAVRKNFGNQIYPGDIFVINDPYILGCHMNDTAHLAPIFADEDLIFWVVVRVHYTDIGGMTAGSITADAREVYQEGLRIPAVKAYEAGKASHTFLEMFLANVRLPEERRSDFMAVMAAFRTGAKRFHEILETYGKDAVIRTSEIVRDRDERRMRAAIARLPAGEYAYEINLDSDGERATWVPIRVVVHIEGESLTVDFSESASVMRGNMNGVEATAACASYIAIKGLLDPTPFVSSGSFRPIRVITRFGTLFGATLPAPTSGSQELMFRTMAAVLGAFAPATPENALGDHCATGPHYISGWDPAQERFFVMYDSPLGGTGAVVGNDGNDVLAGFERGDHGRIMPVETMETEFPFLCEFSELRPDSGGAGKHRGGLGIRRGWRMLRGEGVLSDIGDPSITPLNGVMCAHGGASSTSVIVRQGQLLTPGVATGRVVRFPLQAGDLIVILKWGGGGYGDSLERDPEAVLADVLEGYVSREAAQTLYGVVLIEQRVDLALTQRLRERLRGERLYLRAMPHPPRVSGDKHRVWQIAPSVAERLCVREGDVAECLTPGIAPLRGRVLISSHQAPDELVVDPFGMQVLRVLQGERVWIRRMFDPVNLDADVSASDKRRQP